MNAARRSDWESVYLGRREAQTSWHRPHLDESLRLIGTLDLAKDAALLDAGGGRATLVDDLLERGFSDVSVLDISSAALDEARARLGPRCARVHWIAGDIRDVEFPAARYALWHDRALFHFLVDAASRERYVAQMARAVRLGGYAVIATFAPDGPERCSGLPVERYDAGALAAQFAPAFVKLAESRELHRTPSGGEQPFTYVVLRRLDAVAPQTIEQP